MRWWRSLLPVVFLVMAWGLTTGCGAKCQLNSDCPVGSHCSSGKCEDGCQQHKDCPEGNYCSEGKCEWDCKDAFDCRPGQACSLYGQCVAVGGSPDSGTPGDSGVEPDSAGPADKGVWCREYTREACYDGPKGTNGVGICRAGERYCYLGKWSDCAGQVKPTSEVCNGKDDDCDGKADEGLDCRPLHKDCTRTKKCATGYSCVYVDSSRQRAVCLQDCTHSASVCKGNTDGRIHCVDTYQSVKVCAEKMWQGSPCGLGQSKVCDAMFELACKNGKCVKAEKRGSEWACGVNPAVYCKQGLACTPFQYGRMCVPTVSSCSVSCPSGRVCVPLSNGTGACLIDCHLRPRFKCPNETICADVNKRGVCQPPSPQRGDLGFGKTCGGSYYVCQWGQEILCLIHHGHSKGYCTKRCSLDSDCPRNPAGATCHVSIGDGTKACGFPCDSGQRCPTGMVCNSTYKRCLPY